MFQAAAKKIAQRGIKTVVRELAPACLLLFVGCYMLLIFEPILMYATNMDDFWFDFQLMIGPVLSVAVIFFLIGIVFVAAVYIADLLITNGLLLYKRMILLGFAVFFLLYLQGNWLAGNLPQLSGAKIVWENYGKQETVIFVSAAIILIGAMIVLVKKRGLDRTIFYSAACAAAVFVMLSAALVSVVAANNVLDKEGESFDASMKNFNMISSNKNFLIFLVDCAHSQTFYDAMMGDDDFRGMMEDFTYYPDTLAAYRYTKQAIPNILAGAVFDNENNYTHYSRVAYNQSPLFEKLTQNEYEINLYSNDIKWNGEKNYRIENTIPSSDKAIDSYIFAKHEIKYALFKYLPYGLKQLPLRTPPYVNFELCRKPYSDIGSYQWETAKNYEYIAENSILDKQSNNYFQFVHCEGAHPPFDLDKNITTIEDGTYEQKMAASLTLVKAYLQRLKDNNAYDNSVIVIMADHGWDWDIPVDEQSELDWHIIDRYRPALFIKGINEKHEMLVSDRSVSYLDLQDAFCDLVDGKQSTELFTEFEPGRTRTIFWNTLQYPDYMLEHSATGTTAEVEKFVLTEVGDDFGG